MFRLPKQLQRLLLQELVQQERRMDFRHLKICLGYLSASKASTACIISKNSCLLSIPFSPMCLSEPQYYWISSVQKNESNKKPKSFYDLGSCSGNLNPPDIKHKPWSPMVSNCLFPVQENRYVCNFVSF